MDWVECFFCGRRYLKNIRHVNENIKLKHNFYCSPRCQYSFKNKKIKLNCENPQCKKIFKRQPSDISPHNYCSSFCAAIINNVKFHKKILIHKCSYCGVRLLKYRKYCSALCISNALTISEVGVIFRIRNFYKEHGRIPVKREMWGIYKPARKYFGTWNNAIKVAGFESNPIMFAKRQVAKDGHVCDSLAEKMIDDYLYSKNIQHQRCIPYPEGEYTADFKIGVIFIEYFGLVGEHKRYDELRVIKQKIARKYQLKLIEVYPKDLYPNNKLEVIFGS